MTATGFEIVPFDCLADNGALRAQIDSVFFTASTVQTFASCASRTRFRERWLGRYLDHLSQHAFLALDRDRRVAGYVVGALVDPAQDRLFADAPCRATFARHTARCPAHLHINLAPQYRSLGVGARLIEAFCRHAAGAGVAGVHVITNRDARNVSFYVRNHFAPAAEAVSAGRTLLLLCRSL